MGRKGQKKQKPPPSSSNQPSEQLNMDKISSEAPRTSRQTSESTSGPCDKGVRYSPDKVRDSGSPQNDVDAPVVQEQTPCQTASISMPSPPPSRTVISASSASDSTHLSKQKQPTPLDPDRTTAPSESSHATSNRRTVSNKMVNIQPLDSPLVIACISCNGVCLIKTRVEYKHEKLGVRPDCKDTFFAVVCDMCQQGHHLAWCRIANRNAKPSPEYQYPGSISSRFLTSWFVYEHCRKEFRANIDENTAQNKLITRARDWWREGALKDNTGKDRITYWWPSGQIQRDDGSTQVAWEEYAEWRKDLFFGQPVPAMEY